MVYSFLFAYLGCGIAAAAFGLLLPGSTLKTVLAIAFAVIALIFCGDCAHFLRPHDLVLQHVPRL